MFRFRNGPKISRAVYGAALAITGAAILALGSTAIPSPANADELIASIARGGLLYDRWYELIGADAPKTAHPAYPADKKYANDPGANWRCKECHGWDYRGKDGAYATGGRSTGIKGINGMMGADAAKVVSVLKDKTHAFAGKLADTDFTDLANFVSRGQFDTDKYIDRATKLPINADARRGADIFNTVCARCHGMDGTRPKDMEETLGGQMGNPWEVMHKIMNGDPSKTGQVMPSMRAFGPQVAADVMAHMLTLPKKR